MAQNKKVALPPKQTAPPQRVEVTLENAPKLTVHFLENIYRRLGYLIKLIEDSKGKGKK